MLCSMINCSMLHRHSIPLHIHDAPSLVTLGKVNTVGKVVVLEPLKQHSNAQADYNQYGGRWQQYEGCEGSG